MQMQGNVKNILLRGVEKTTGIVSFNKQAENCTRPLEFMRYPGDCNEITMITDN